MAKGLPQFLGLGTQKGGTTSLHLLLDTHPAIFLPACKEVQYHSLHDDKPLAWYSAHYKDAVPLQLRGDITPYYLFHPRAPRNIHRTIPDARLIVLLRDPVERTLSQYFHARRHGFEVLELAPALAAEAERLRGAEERLAQAGSWDYSHQKHSYVSRSRYEQQLDRYEALFSAEQLLVLKSEDLFAHPQGSWERLLRFLSLDPMPLPQLPAANSGRCEAADVPQTLRQQLRAELATTAAAMRKRYGIDWGWPD
jgi:hypothetical protein